ncbi:hypothetical protein PFISCL1PPCAC_25015, partial [Pristionchus fissidentatus]
PGGWRDVDNKKITAAALADFDCAKSPCSKSTSPLCGANNLNIPPGYACIDNPFSRTDDPNVLKCAELEIMYDKADFIEDRLRCNDDKKWYKKGETTEFDRVSNLICVHLLCNKCKSAPTLIASSAPPVAFTKGEPNKCATVTCANNLWKVKKTAAGPAEEYNGEVKCNSDATSTDGKWTIDDGSQEIVEAGC